jgi:hypothetical protein
MRKFFLFFTLLTIITSQLVACDKKENKKEAQDKLLNQLITNGNKKAVPFGNN